jgi:hypothetical protein
MKVQLGAKEIWIEFAYLERESESWIEYREITRCLLRDGSAPRDNNHRESAPILAQGEVARYYKDQPNRDTARKQALAKALKKLVPSANALALDKAQRKLFWEAYLNRKKKAPHAHP